MATATTTATATAPSSLNHAINSSPLCKSNSITIIYLFFRSFVANNNAHCAQRGIYYACTCDILNMGANSIPVYSVSVPFIFTCTSFSLYIHRYASIEPLLELGRCNYGSCGWIAVVHVQDSSTRYLFIELFYLFTAHTTLARSLCAAITYNGMQLIFFVAFRPAVSDNGLSTQTQQTFHCDFIPGR